MRVISHPAVAAGGGGAASAYLINFYVMALNTNAIPPLCFAPFVRQDD